MPCAAFLQQREFALELGEKDRVAPGEAQSLFGLAETGLGLLFLKHGRDDERQADDLGLRYLVVAGFDPRLMADMFDMLDRVSAASGNGGTPGWLSTHPTPENRRERSESRIAALVPVRSTTGASITSPGPPPSRMVAALPSPWISRSLPPRSIFSA